MDSIHFRIRGVFREVFEDDEMEIFDEMNARSVPNWDSLAQVKLIIGIEEEFGIKLTTHDVTRLTCVGDVRRLLETAGVKE